MPLLPSRQELHVNVPLRNYSLAYMQDQDEFIADKVFPSIPVQKQSDRYVVYLKEYWFRTQAQKRAPASESVGTGYRVDNTPTYFCDEWAIHKDVPYEDYENADDYLTPDSDATELVSRHLKLRQEKIFIEQYMQPGVWQGFIPSTGTDTADFNVDTHGNGYWDSPTSDPMMDVDLQRKRMKGITGFMPNTMVMGQSVYFALRNHPAIRDVFKYSEIGILDPAKLAAVFGVPRLFVAGAVIDSSAGAKPDLGFISDNDVLLCYAAPNPGLKTPTAGLTFNWVGRPGSGAMGNTVYTIDMPLLRAKRIEAGMSFDMRQIGPDLGIYSPKVLQNVD